MSVTIKTQTEPNFGEVQCAKCCLKAALHCTLPEYFLPGWFFGYSHSSTL